MIPSIEETQLSLVVKEPLGVIAAIVPWNYPLLLLSWKLARPRSRPETPWWPSPPS